MKNYINQIYNRNSFTHQAARRVLICSLLSSVLFSSSLMAEIVNGGTWIIKSGDSLYKIARVIFPESTKKQAQLRKALVNENPDVFKNGTGNISVGDQLQLPAFAIKQQEPAAALVVAPAVIEPVAAPEPEISKPAATQAENLEPTAAIVTPDPQDIVGQVVINIGSLNAENRGSSRVLNRRSPIYRGDTLATGGRSMTQIRLKDGALLSLRPHTQIKIAQYQYNGAEDGTEKSVIELLKGGFRTITGAIGHLNKQNYQIKTSMATIGIRGTHYSLMLCQQASCSGDGKSVDDGLYGGVADGSIVIENQTGEHTFNNDQFFHLTSISALPVETLVPPQMLHQDTTQGESAPQEADEQQAEQAPNRTGKSQPRRLAIIFEPNMPNPVKKSIKLPKDLDLPPLNGIRDNINLAPDGSGVLVSFNEKDIVGAVIGAIAPIVVNNNSNIIALAPGDIPIFIAETSFDNELQRNVTSDFTAATADGTPIGLPSDLGRDTNLGANWGRWNGEYTVRRDEVQVNTLQNLHFIYSENTTSPTQLANLGGIKGNFVSYASTGGTLPSDNLGNIGSNFAIITMNVDFIAQTIDTYDVSASVIDATTGNDIIYTAGILSPIAFSALNSDFQIDSSSGCVGGLCSGDASVQFIGPEATGAITSYQISDVQIGSSINGAAILTEGAIEPVIP